MKKLDKKAKNIEENKNIIKNEEDESQGNYIAMGMCLGVSIGAGIGVAINNLPVGISMGLCIGLLLGTVIKPKK